MWSNQKPWQSDYQRLFVSFTHFYKRLEKKWRIKLVDKTLSEQKFCKYIDGNYLCCINSGAMHSTRVAGFTEGWLAGTQSVRWF